jgi:hypothetical protein
LNDKRYSVIQDEFLEKVYDKIQNFAAFTISKTLLKQVRADRYLEKDAFITL